MMRYRQVISSLLLVLSGILPATAEDTKGKGSEMARVAVIKYEDKTGTKNFGYMPGSLQEAITKSMHTKFEFVEIDPETVEPSVAELRTKNKGVIDAKVAAEICRKTNTDILIYGNFIFNTEDKEIEIQTYISLGSTDKHRTLKPVENRVDATIFQAADRVAADIVAEITKVAIEQQQAKGDAEKNQKGKTQLAKTEKSKTWADLNWMLSLTIGANMPLVNRSQTDLKPDGVASLLALYRLKGAWHGGLMTTFGGFKSSANGMRTDFNALSVAAVAGYFFDLSARWRLATLGGAGYYFGELSNYSSGYNSGSGFQSSNVKVRNPFYLARTGIHFLIFSFLSLGLEGEWRMYYDSPKPLQAIGVSLAISATF